MKLNLVSSALMRLILAFCLVGALLACVTQAQDAQDTKPQPPQTEKAQQPSQGQARDAQAKNAQAHDAQEEVEVNDHPRTYVVHLPQGYDSQQHYPVVILLHGRDQDAAEMARITHFNELADKDSIIAVYPNAMNGRWNIGAGQPQYYRRGPYRRPGVWGPGYPPGPRRGPGERGEGPARGADIPFFNRMLDKLSSHYSVDTRRIYATGLGEGGFTALHMGCDMADRIAAIAVAAAAMPKTLNCVPSRPIPFLFVNGTDDPIVHYDGGRYRDGLLHLLSAEDSAKQWARLNRCAEKPAESKLPSSQKGWKDTKVYMFDGCQQNAQVALYAIKDGGHTWPGGEQYLNEKEIGKTSHAFNANEVIWSFLVTRKIVGESGVEK